MTILSRALLRHSRSPAAGQIRLGTIGGAVVRSPVGRGSGGRDTFTRQ